ncbi:MAG: T9SS type A sorting domain-containing protein [Bacteroidia bacterium]
MKKAFLILMLAYQCLTAQVYTPFPTQNAVWRGSYVEGPGPGVTLHWDYQLFIAGDTLIQNTNYHNWYLTEVHSQWWPQLGLTVYLPTTRPFGAFREDNKKIYLWDYQDSTEYLLYDFDSLAVGDDITNWYNTTNRYLGINTKQIDSFFIGDIDSVLIANTYRKRYHIMGSCNLTDTYLIEGIGYTDPVTMCGFEEGSSLICFTLNDSLIWQSSAPFPYCGLPYPTVGLTYTLSSSAFIYPNPFTSELNLTFSKEIKALTILIYDLRGKLLYDKKVENQKEIQLELTKLPSGMYHLLMYDEQGHSMAQKLVKE